MQSIANIEYARLRNNIYLPFFIFFLLFSSCTQSGKFVRAPELRSDRGALILMRPAMGVWVFRDWKLKVSRFEGHFTEGNEIPVETVELSENEFLVRYLEEGFYKIEMSDFDGVWKIVHIKPEKRLYLSVFLYGGGTFETPDAILREMEEKKAVGLLLTETGMDRHESSDDPLYVPR